MIYKRIYFFLVAFLFFAVSCDNEETTNQGTAVVNFSISSLREVENADTPIAIYLGLDSFEHAAGSVNIEISGGQYGTDYVTNTGSDNFTLDVEAGSLVSSFSITPVDDNVIGQGKQLTITITSATGGLEVGDHNSLIFTILDNDDPTVAMVDFELPTIEVQENATEATTVNLVLDQASTAGGTITINATGDAVLGTDYTIDGVTELPFILTVPENGTAASFDISPIDNTDFVSGKTVTFTVSEVSGGLQVGTQTETAVSIINDDTPATIGFDSPTIAIQENATDATVLNIAFDQAAPSAGTVTVTVEGDAVLGTDYTIDGVTELPFTIDVPEGSETAGIAITPIDNADFEADKTLTFTLSAVTGGLQLGEQNTTVVTLVNDDAPANPVIDFENATASIAEDGGILTLNFVLSSATAADATVEIAANASSTATIGADYDLDGQATSPYVLNIPSGSTTASLAININDDTDIEGDETIVLDITSATGGLDIGVTTVQQTITVADNDVATSFSYVETFESISDLADIGYQIVTIGQDPTLPSGAVLKYHNKPGEYADVDDVTAASNSGIQIFQKLDNGGGLVDNMVVTSLLEGSGSMDVSIDMAYVTGLNKNNAEITTYWSDSYDGSGTFEESQWNVMETVTAQQIKDNEGLGTKEFSRRSYSITPSANFYLAIRVKQVVDTDHDALQWRFDNIQVNSK